MSQDISVGILAKLEKKFSGSIPSRDKTFLLLSVIDLSEVYPASDSKRAQDNFFGDRLAEV